MLACGVDFRSLGSYGVRRDVWVCHPRWSCVKCNTDSCNDVWISVIRSKWAWFTTDLDLGCVQSNHELTGLVSFCLHGVAAAFCNSAPTNTSTPPHPWDCNTVLDHLHMSSHGSIIAAFFHALEVCLTFIWETSLASWLSSSSSDIDTTSMLWAWRYLVYFGVLAILTVQPYISRYSVSWCSISGRGTAYNYVQFRVPSVAVDCCEQASSTLLCLWFPNKSSGWLWLLFTKSCSLSTLLWLIKEYENRNVGDIHAWSPILPVAFALRYVRVYLLRAVTLTFPCHAHQSHGRYRMYQSTSSSSSSVWTELHVPSTWSFTTYLSIRFPLREAM